MSRVYYGLDVEQGKKAFMGASEFVLSDKNKYFITAQLIRSC